MSEITPGRITTAARGLATLLAWAGTLALVTTTHAQGVDRVAGRLVLLNVNGGWSWFSDERAIVDRARGEVLVGSLANRHGAGGREKDGDVEVTHFDPATGARRTHVLRDALVSYGGGDDHNSPALLRLPDGRILAAYTGHNNDTLTYLRTYEPDAERWGEERSFDWDEAIPGGADFNCTYSNLFWRPEERSVVNIARNHRRCPNLMVSHDLGASWAYGGQLLRPSDVALSEQNYVNGYLKYSAAPDGRVHFLATEAHPRDFNTSLFHGYLQGGQLFTGDGRLVDDDLTDAQRVQAIDLTPVFRAGAAFGGEPMTRAWMVDVEAYANGRVAALFKARAGDSMDDHRFFHAAFNGRSWRCRQIAKAGPRLFPREEDYTGLGALDPDDPDVVFLSTPISPITGEATDSHEIYRGRTRDEGARWTWEALTAHSRVDNLRPIVPAWDREHTAVIWTRGVMRSSQNYDQAVVGLIEAAGETRGPIHYVDATPENTTGVADGWRWEQGWGNGASVLSAGGGRSGQVATEIRGLADGQYDVFVYFWSDEEGGGRLRAALDGSPMEFSTAHTQAADPHASDSDVQATANGRRLYQAYLGRARASDGEALRAVIQGAEAGAAVDGVGYSLITQ